MMASILAFVTFVTLLTLVTLPAFGRINVVTLPGRNSVQLTIYNSADLTLVKETRLLTFRKGLNRLEFSWANTLIDPTSVEFRAVTRADEVEVLDVSFPPRVTNTLEWRIKSEFAGEIQIEIRYFTSGISWSADYVAESDKTEKLIDLAGNVRVNNNSGEDYENAQVRLVVGVIRLIDEIAKLAQAGKPGEPHPAPPAAPLSELRAKSEVAKRALDELEVAAINRPKEIVKEGISEYFLYTVEGRDTIPTGWAKRLPSFKALAIPNESYYKFEREQWGDRVIRYYRFTNNVTSHLGNEPLPDGAVKAFRFASEDKLYSFVGSTTVKYIPVNEQVELELGNDLEVLVKPRLTNWQKTDVQFDNKGNVKGWTTKETWEIETQNSKDIDATVDIRRNFKGDWTLTSPVKYEKVDARKVKFVRPLKAHTQEKFSYELVTRHGTNAAK